MKVRGILCSKYPLFMAMLRSIQPCQPEFMPMEKHICVSNKNNGGRWGGGRSDKVNRTFFQNKNVFIIKNCLFLQPSCCVKKNTVLFVKTEVFAVNWFQRHFNLWCLYSGALFYQWQFKNVFDSSLRQGRIS